MSAYFYTPVANEKELKGNVTKTFRLFYINKVLTDDILIKE